MPILIETQTFPPIITIALALKHQGITIEGNENYNKGSYRNRFELMSSLGRTTLSIPLEKGKNNGMPIKNVQISYAENWQKNHLRSIQSYYGKSPFFEEYFSYIEKIYSIDFDHLFDFNMKALDLILQLLQLPIDIHLTKDFKNNQSENQKDLKDYRNIILPNSSKSDFDFHFYSQVFEDRIGFTPNLSVLDLLFCMGPESLFILRKCGEKGFKKSS